MVKNLVAVAILAATAGAVKELFTHKEFTDVLAEAGGRPVIVITTAIHVALAT